MQILVLGSGGREHALVWKLAAHPDTTVFVAPGNGGTELEGAKQVDIRADDVPGIVSFAKKNRIDLVVPGPELPLTLGVTDALKKAGIACFGPDSYAAKLEGSKSFAKEIMQRAKVPTAACRIVQNLDEARSWVKKMGAPLVVKADGLAAGKGVVVARTEDEALKAVSIMLGDHAFGDAGSTVLLEECLVGEEVSLLCFCDGKNAVPLPSAQDHKAAYDGDSGPNTGGMGAYSPAPVLPESAVKATVEATVLPVLRVLAEDGHPFVGVLYAGLMMTSDGPKVLEYNVRFGDPECQPLLMRLESDLAEVMQACIDGRLNATLVRSTEKTALGVVIAKEGYPGSYEKGALIRGIEKAEEDPSIKVFHSGTKRAADGTLLSTGGRILCVTALADSLALAQEKAYAACGKIEIDGSFYRKDIGDKGLTRKRS
ncbi:MAG: phosphoribosylamine--glycine ligase [Desulfovibrio sp.]|nr:phosphoribosylamine--glycine ligase [Desulfovibrio sp.]